MLLKISLFIEVPKYNYYSGSSKFTTEDQKFPLLLWKSFRFQFTGVEFANNRY